MYVAGRVETIVDIDVVVVCLDVSFMTCLPSVLAASSINAASSGLLGHVWCRQVNLLRRLHQLTNIDIVSHQASLDTAPVSSPVSTTRVDGPS